MYELWFLAQETNCTKHACFTHRRRTAGIRVAMYLARFCRQQIAKATRYSHWNDISALPTELSLLISLNKLARDVAKGSYISVVLMRQEPSLGIAGCYF